MENDLIVIGIRGQAKQAKAASIMMLVLAALFAVSGLALGLYLMRQDVEVEIWISVMMVLYVIGMVCLPAGIISLIRAITNDRFLSTKPVLAYDMENDEFIAYDCRRSGMRLVIPNGGIIAIKGSAMWTARELIVKYRDKNGIIYRTSLGFCRNIDNGVFRNELNKYHRPVVY